MKAISRFTRMGSVAVLILASAIAITAVPAGAVTQSEVTSQFTALQNAVQSTQAYSSITGSWSSSEQSDLGSEVNAIRNGNTTSSKNYASSVDNDSLNESNAMSGTTGWMNSVTYEYQLLQSEESSSVVGYQYARAEFPAATTLDTEAIQAYNIAEAYFASQSTLPATSSGLWGLFCAGVAAIALASAFYTGGVDAPEATSLVKAIALSGTACYITQA